MSESLHVGQRPSNSAGVRRYLRRIGLASGLVVVCMFASTGRVDVIASSGSFVMPTPNPPIANGALVATSCTSSTCVAVGFFIDSEGYSAALAESWNGIAWSVQPTTQPAGSAGSYLYGVSCTAANACIAVGYYSAGTSVLPLAETWNGISWSIQPIPVPSGATTSELLAVSCASPGACAAVGFYSAGAGHLTLAEAWNGTSWSVQATPNPSQSTAELKGVACSAASSCTAVGSSTGSLSGSTSTLAQRWNGIAWTLQVMPNISGTSVLNGLTCTSANSCTAVGYYNSGSLTGGVPFTLAEAWDGGSWAIQPTPNPTGSIPAYLASVSCTAVNVCTAVGYYEPSSGVAPILSLAESWNGSNWSLQSTPNPAGTINALLLGVACTSSSACQAVGDYATQGSPVLSLAESWNGNQWAIQTTPNASGSMGATLNAISCSSANSCAGVGDYFDQFGNQNTLAEMWDGNSWSIQPTPNPPTSTTTSVELLGISCPSAASCIAVGRYATGSGHQTLAEGWNGSTWSMQSTPNPSANVSLTSVSCTTANSCVAVGSYSTGSNGNPLTLAETWDGLTWTVQSTPNPSGALGAALNAVSCTSASACTAVGYSYFSTSPSLTMAERWDGNTWSMQPTVTPPGQVTPQLTGVSCASATACTAVGFYYGGSGYPLTLAESWDGSTWTLQPSPNPSGSILAEFSGVSCTSVSRCTAIGYYWDSAAHFFTLAETWDGTSWSIVSTPTPLGSKGGRLIGVVTTAVSWVAVGQGNSVTLAESAASNLVTSPYSAVSTQSYSLTNSDGVTWKDVDATNLKLTVSPTANATAILGGNADLWTANAGYNQDLAISVSVDGATDAVIGWKESGGFAGTFSPNAVFVQTAYPVSSGHTYVFKLKWKTNRSATGATIYAAAGPGPAPYSPTSLTADLIPSGANPYSAVSTQSYNLTNSDGVTWKDVDATNLKLTVSPIANATAILGGNSDLWTANAGYNQDLAISVSVDGGADAVIAWKESGGFAGTFSPNAVFVQTAYPVSSGHTYVFKLKWKTNRSATGATIYAAAGPGPAPYSPTSLTATLQ